MGRLLEVYLFGRGGGGGGEGGKREKEIKNQMGKDIER